MGIFRLRRKTKNFGLLGGPIEAVQAKKAIQMDALKHGEIGSFLKQGFIQTPGTAQKYLDRNPGSKYSNVIKDLYGKRVSIPSTNASIAMGAPAGPSIGGTGAGVGGY